MRLILITICCCGYTTQIHKLMPYLSRQSGRNRPPEATAQSARPFARYISADRVMCRLSSAVA